MVDCQQAQSLLPVLRITTPNFEEAEMERTLFPSPGRLGRLSKLGRVGRFVVTKEETEVRMELPPSGLMTCQRGLKGEEEVFMTLIHTSHHGPLLAGLLSETPQRNPIELS